MVLIIRKFLTTLLDLNLNFVMNNWDMPQKVLGLYWVNYSNYIFSNKSRIDQLRKRNWSATKKILQQIIQKQLVPVMLLESQQTAILQTNFVFVNV